MTKKKHKRSPKAVLRLPDLEQSKSSVLNSLPSPNSRRSYDHAIREFIEWYCSEPRLALNRTVVTRYRICLEQAHYSSATINLRLAAVRRLAYEAADSGLLSPDLAAGIRRVKGAKRLGVRIGNWLTAEQGNRLLDQAGDHAKTVGTAIKGRVGLVIAHPGLQGRDHIGRDVRGVGDDQIKRRLRGNRLEQVTQAEVDAIGHAVPPRILAGQCEGVRGTINGHELDR